MSPDIFPSMRHGDALTTSEHTRISSMGCTDRFHAILHMPRCLKKVDVIYICFLLFHNIELYINKILR